MGTSVASEKRRAGGDTRTARRTFQPSPEAASEARHFTSEVLRAWGVAAPEDAVLVAAELATNAVRHARSAFVLSLRWHDDRVRIAVRDRDPAGPRPLEQTSAATGGRGLLIVRRLATSWGWEAVPDGKSIWATVQVPARGYAVTCVPPAIA